MKGPGPGLRRPKHRLRGQVHDLAVVHVLERGSTTVGAGPDCDLVLDHRSVSRRHAVLRLDEEGLSVEDLGAKNGTFVNGRRVGRAPLEEGDEVGFGPVALVLESIHVGDAQVAIPLAPPLATGGRREDDRTRSERGADPARLSRWLDLLQELVTHQRGRSVEGRAAALHSVLAGLGAASVALVTWEPNGEAILLASQGDAPPAAALSVAGGQLGSAEPSAPVLLGDLGSSPLALVPLAPLDGSPVALAVAGDFPGRSSSGPFLTAVGHALGPLLPTREAAPAPPDTNLVFPADHLVGHSAAMDRVYEEIRQLVAGDLPVLVTGETGAGKEHIARILHASSRRSRGPFVAVNCAAIPGELLEAELFGVGHGVATGVARREGTLQLAHGGVVFLDEIADMAPALQAKLLRALQEMEVQPVGTREVVSIDVRLVSATNANVEGLLARGALRRDLYYRLAGYTLEIPPLRRRREDIPTLVEHFLRRSAAEVGKPVRGVTARALELMCLYSWPGNLRELQHEARRLVYRCPAGAAVDSALLSSAILAGAREGSRGTDAGLLEPGLKEQVADLERRLILGALARAGGNRSEAARLLGLSRNGLLLKLQRLGVEPG